MLKSNKDTLILLPCQDIILEVVYCHLRQKKKKKKSCLHTNFVHIFFFFYDWQDEFTRESFNSLTVSSFNAHHPGVEDTDDGWDKKSNSCFFGMLCQCSNK